MNATTWTAIGAIATGVMAIATFVLAFKTRSMAKATKAMVDETKAVAQATLLEARAVEKQSAHIEAQVKVSTKALNASVQPWLVWLRKIDHHANDGVATLRAIPTADVHQNGDNVSGFLIIKNIGAGIALVNPSQSFIYRGVNPDDSFSDIHPIPESPIIPPGEQVKVNFTIPGNKGSNQQNMTLVELLGGDQHGAMHIELSYSDVLNAINVRVRFHIYRPAPTKSAPEPWRVIETTYSQNGGEPIIVRNY